MRFRTSIAVALLRALLLCLLPGRVEAGGRRPVLQYRGGGQGKVVFDHQLHASKGCRCNDCHTDFSGTGKQLFATRKQALISFADHHTATRCFACHNGKKEAPEAFDKCVQCHRKAPGS
jgi:thiosulfate reductase cytochrome b subunit